MKNLLVTLLLLLPWTTYGKEWFEETITEDKNNFYYVGVSSKKLSEKEALEDAYADALKEAVRHNFGVMHDYVGQYAQSESDLKIRQNTLLYRSGVKIVGAVPLNKIVIEDDDKYIAYRKVKYPKAQIAIEKERLKHIKEKKLTLEPVELPEPEHDFTMPSDINVSKAKKERNTVFRTKDVPTVSWVWMPIAGDEEKTEFMTMPFKLDLYPARYISIGFTYIYDADQYEEDYDSTTAKENDSYTSSYLAHTEKVRNEVTNDLTFDLKLYPIRTKWLSLGFGTEYVYYRKKIYLGDDEDTNVLEESQIETTGKNATLRITLEPVNDEGAGTSLYMDYREFDERKIYSVGLSFDY